MIVGEKSVLLKFTLDKRSGRPSQVFSEGRRPELPGNSPGGPEFLEKEPKPR